MNTHLLLLVATIALAGLAFAQGNSVERTERRFYGFYDDGGEHPGSECETTPRLPEKLKRENALLKLDGYVGSEQTEFSEQNEATIDAWMHYFSSRTTCEQALKKLNEYYETER